LDSVGAVPFLRAVRGRERPEMTMVFSLYRDAAGLIPAAVYSLLLTFFDLSAVFVAAGLRALACAWLSRYLPRRLEQRPGKTTPCIKKLSLFFNSPAVTTLVGFGP